MSALRVARVRWLLALEWRILEVNGRLVGDNYLVRLIVLIERGKKVHRLMDSLVGDNYLVRLIVLVERGKKRPGGWVPQASNFVC